MAKFFIGFAGEDSQLADFVHGFLVKNFDKAASFFISRRLPPSSEWKERIRDEHSLSAAGLFLLTPRSQNKMWVNLEIGGFHFQYKPVFLLLSGGLHIKDLNAPLADIQVASLTDPVSVESLFHEMGRLCKLRNLHIDVRRFCRTASRLAQANRAIPNLSELKKQLRIRRTPRPERLYEHNIVLEALSLKCVVIRETIAQVSGTVRDTATLILKMRAPSSADFLVIEARHTNGMRCDALEKMIKVGVNHEPILPHFIAQQHWNDREYVPREDGFFVYSLRECATTDAFLVKLIFHRAELENVQFRIYLIKASA